MDFPSAKTVTGNEQMSLIYASINPVIVCEQHGEIDVRGWWTPEEMVEQFLDQGWLDCPYCLWEIVGYEG